MTQFYGHQNAFNAGVLAPSVFGRSDLPAYRAGLKRCENFLIMRPGGMERRPGTIFVAEGKNPLEPIRLITFRFSNTQSYVLSFTPTHLRIYTNNALVNHGTYRISVGNTANKLTDEIRVENHGYSDGLGIKFTPVGAGTLPAPLVAGKRYTVALPPTLTPNATSEISTPNNSAQIVPASLLPVGDGLGEEIVDRMGPFHLSSSGNMPSPNWLVNTDYYLSSIGSGEVKFSLTPGGSVATISATGSGTMNIAPTMGYKRSLFRVRDPITGRIVNISSIGSGQFDVEPFETTPFEIPLSYLESELREIQPAQDKDVMYLTHGNLPTQRLVRYGDAAWEMEDALLEDGPYLEVGEIYPGDAPEDLLLNVASPTGSSVQLNASSAIFKNSDIGRSVRIGNDNAGDEWGWAKITGIAGVLWTDPDWNDDSSTARAGTLLTMVAHPFTTGEGPVRVDAPNMGLLVGTDYYIRSVSVDTVSIHLSEADAINNVAPRPLAAHVATKFVSSWLKLSEHGFLDGDGPVTLSTSNTLTTGLTFGTDYFITVKDADHIQFTLTQGGAPIAIADDDGLGQHTINGGAALAAVALVDIQTNLEGLGIPTTMAGSSWRLGAFGSDPRLGYPAAVTLHEQRLVLAGAAGTPQTVYGSQSQNQLNFAPDQDDPNKAAGGTDSGYERILTSTSSYTYRLNSEDLNTINWLRPVRILFAAGLGGIHHLSGSTIAEAITPVNVNAKRGTPVGSSSVTPLTFDTSIVFVDESLRSLQRAEFRPDLEAIETTNLSGLADHLVTRGQSFVELARIQTPLPIVWSLRSDGLLMSLTLDAQQRVAAWSTGHPIGGPSAQVESIATLPDSQDGELWLSVIRTIGGNVTRHIERMAPRFQEGDDQSLYQGFDGGPIPYNAGVVPAGSPFAGVEHLAGETISILADGGTHPDVVVSAGGTFVLERDASKVVVGFPFVAEAEGLPPVLDSQLAQDLSNRPVRVVEVLIRMRRAGGIEVGRTTADLAPIPFRDALDLMDAPVPLFSGVKRVVINGTYDEDDAWVIRCAQPIPAQILSITPRLDFPNI